MYMSIVCDNDLCPSQKYAGWKKFRQMPIRTISLVEGRADFKTVAAQCPDCGHYHTRPLTIPIEVGKQF